LGLRAKTVDTIYAAGDSSRLFAEIQNSRAALRMRVTGPSMVPLIHSNDLVTVRKVPVADLMHGDIVLFINHSGAAVVHRILRKHLREGRIYFHTKGDARLEYDQWIDESKILGKVCLIEKPRLNRPPRIFHLEKTPWRLGGMFIAFLQIIYSKVILAVRSRLTE
jgi:signal peptidase I